MKEKSSVKGIYKIISPHCVLVKEESSFRHNGKLIEIATKPYINPDELADDIINGYYEQLFGQECRNLVFLCGAGTSVECGKCESKGMTRKELWDSCEPERQKINDFFNDEKLRNIDNDIEKYLSRTFLLQAVNEEICGTVKLIEKKIQEACNLELGEQSPQLELLNKAVSRKVSNPRVKIFTTNYDTLFEQAAAKGAFVVVDGFSYSQPRIFSGRYFDVDFVDRNKTRLKNEDNFIPKVFHLYKLHGSLWWKRDERNDGRIVQEKYVENPLIVYPASNKFESSYEQPYFEMMSRFQSCLRMDDLMFVVLGFGFNDKHIQNVIIEAVHQNANFQLVVIDYGIDGGIDVDKYLDLGLLKKEGEKVIPINKVSLVQGDFSEFVRRYPINKTYDVSLNDE